jgi:hypothetical protein
MIELQDFIKIFDNIHKQEFQNYKKYLFKGNIIDGYGILYNEHGYIIYMGMFKNYKKYGNGIRFYTKGKIKKLFYYDGEWNNGFYNGYIKSYDDNDNLLFTCNPYGDINYSQEWFNYIDNYIDNYDDTLLLCYMKCNNKLYKINLK